MKKSIWYMADIYGQLTVWLLSFLPFIYFLSEAFRKADFYMLWLVHGLGLMIIGLWQMTSTLLNLLFAAEKHKRFFRNNIWIGFALVVIFLLWAYSGNFRIPLSEVKYRNSYFMAAYFVVVDLAVIRYWTYINRYYKQISHG